ncbi:MAG: Hsp33 family molecular chaperone HslO [Thermodesulfobacteriota bacterium]
MGDESNESAVERYKRRRAERLAGPPQYVDPLPPVGEDTLWRGLTRAGEIRVLVARTTQTVTEAARRLEASRDATRIVAELVTAGMLVRSTLNPYVQLQMLLRNPGSAGRLIVDVWSGEGGVRAAIARPGVVEERDGPAISDGLLEVVRVARDGSPYRSALQYAAGGIGAAVTEYLIRSEQIVALVDLETAFDGDRLVAAVGYLVQLMPEGSRADLDRLLASVDGAGPLQRGMSEADPDGRAWAARLLDGFLWDQVARERPRFRCRCSRERLLAALATLPRADVEELVESGEPTTTTCEYCNATYTLSVPELQLLLTPPQ